MANGDPGTGTQSMLLDETINDDQLAQALAQAHAGELHWLAVTWLTIYIPSLPEPAAQAWRIVAVSLAQVVVERDRLWERPSLRAWLARLALGRCQGLERRVRFRWLTPQRAASRPFPPAAAFPTAFPAAFSAAFPPAFQSAWDKMGRYERLALLLHHVLGLTLEETAWVFDSEPYPIEYWIREGLRKISYAALRTEAKPAPVEGEAGLMAAIRLLFPIRSPGQDELYSLQAEIATRVQAARRRRRAAISARETVLVSLVLGALFFTCRAAGLLPEEIIHRYKTPVSEAAPSTTAVSTRPFPTPVAPFYFYYSAQEDDTLDSLARRSGTTVEGILSLNPYQHFGRQDAVLQPGERLRLPAGPEMGQAASTPGPPATALPPLTARSDLDTILERVENQRLTWRTLWASVQENDYGPPGYLGPPRFQLPRQAWLSQPGRARIVFRFNLEGFYSLFYLNGFNFRVLDDPREIMGEYVGEVDEIPWYYAGWSSSWRQYALLYTARGNMGTYRLEESSVRVIREETHAGRRAVVIEGTLINKTRRLRLWVDALTGVILRRLDYSAESPGVVLQEAGVEAIVFDAAFPAGIFDPSLRATQGFVQGPSGTPLPAGQELSPSPLWPDTPHIRLAPVPAPPGFDPSRQPVFLQWPETWEQAKETPTPVSPRFTATAGSAKAPPLGNSFPQTGGTTAAETPPRIQVFGGPYFLGSLPLEWINFGGCRRSPDGRLIALRAYGIPEGIPNSLYWFSLEAPQALHEVCRECEEQPFAFSPDSQSLAYTGCREISSPPGCAIFVRNLPTHNLSSWQISNDIAEAYPFYLDWSPEGRFLAILALVEDWTQTRLKILDLQTGEITYSGAYDPVSGSVAPEAPTREWGLTFPPYDEIEMGCMEP